MSSTAREPRSAGIDSTRRWRAADSEERSVGRLRVVYVSQGNIPSRWAHTIQAVKMAEALTRLVGDLTLVTAGTLMPSPLHAVDIRSLYGISGPLKVRRLPIRLRVSEPHYRNSIDSRFDHLAAWYARLLSPDLVYSRSPGAARRCIRLGLPTILESHATDTHELEGLLVEVDSPSFLGLVTLNTSLRDLYLALGFPAAKTMIAGSGVDLERFSDLPTTRSARETLGLPPWRPLAVYCGHFYPEKGIETLLDAARQLSDVRFCLIGGWPEDIARLRGLARGSDNVTFVGFVPNEQVPVWLAASDLLVLPNSGRHPHARTASPLKLFEYMASRRPIVATDIPALRGLLTDRENALVVPCDSPSALADGIRTLMRDPALGARISARAFRDVQHSTWAGRASAILDFFDLGRARSSNRALGSSPEPRAGSIGGTAKRHAPRRLSIHIVHYDERRDWILGKMAQRLCEELFAMGQHLNVGTQPDPSADINHHIIYSDYVDRKATVETLMITHIDSESKLDKVHRHLVHGAVEMGICMSTDAMRSLQRSGVPPSKLCYINPAHDAKMRPRPIVVGLTTRIYDDARKREYLLSALADVLSPSDFRFTIMGAGWEAIVAELRRKSFDVDFHPAFEDEAYRVLVPGFDYYLYLGNDEGSMGFLDALAAGVPTIVTRQGFHLDVPRGVSRYFDDLTELERIFREIAEERERRIRGVSPWTWAEYARKHVLVWEYLYCSASGTTLPSTLRRELPDVGLEVG